MKTKGAKNIVAFAKRTSIETSGDSEIRHLADSSGSPLEKLRQTFRHQENYLVWLRSRHEKIVEMQTKLDATSGGGAKTGPSGAKEGTLDKYEWYAGQSVLLESINAFELFFKRTFVGLAECLHEYLDPSALENSIDFKLIWAMNGQLSVAELLFEKSLFHNTDHIDNATHILVGKKRYSDTRLKPRVRVIRSIFQIRHTFSHNGGLVTKSDAGKFRLYGYKIADGEVIDPAKNNLRVSVSREILSEAQEFMEWLLVATVDFLVKCDKNGVTLPAKLRPELRALLGNNAKQWKRVPWK